MFDERLCKRLDQRAADQRVWQEWVDRPLLRDIAWCGHLEAFLVWAPGKTILVSENGEKA